MLGTSFSDKAVFHKKGYDFFSMHIMEPNLTLSGWMDQNIYRLNSGWKGLVITIEDINM